MSDTSLAQSRIPFDGRVQSGIEQPAQAHLELLAFDLLPHASVETVAALLQAWTMVARDLTQGRAVPHYLSPELVSVTANLTVTCGLGERVFEVIAKPELKPAGLHEIPVFSRDRLEVRWGQSDLVLQVCCDDPTTLFAASRLLINTAKPWAKLKWMQKGFTFAYGTKAREDTGRNPMGQLDGTVNPREAQQWAQQVWLEGSGADAWMDGSCLMVYRRIRMLLDPWEMLDRRARERVIGRRLDNGGPLSGGGEFDPEDMRAEDENGEFLIHRRSHLALARVREGRPSDKLCRRAYSFDDPPETGSDQSTNSGLVWISYQRNPDLQFSAIQKRLDGHDLLNQYIEHVGSAVYWIPPGTADPSEYWGKSLLEK